MAEILPPDSPGLARRLVSVLGSGGLVIMLCDTIYGIHGRVPDTEARIRALKGRGETKPFIQLIPETAWLERIADQAPDAALAALWPGPLTLVLRARGGGTVAVRCPADVFLAAVIREVGAPLYSTSVNLASSPPLSSPRVMARTFGAGVDLIVDAGDQRPALPSTIVDATVRPYRVLRPGAAAVPSELLRDPSLP